MCFWVILITGKKSPASFEGTGKVAGTGQRIFSEETSHSNSSQYGSSD